MYTKKNELPQEGFEPTTLRTLDRTFYHWYMVYLSLEDDVLALPVLEHAIILQSGDDVITLDA